MKLCYWRKQLYLVLELLEHERVRSLQDGLTQTGLAFNIDLGGSFTGQESHVNLFSFFLHLQKDI